MSLIFPRGEEGELPLHERQSGTRAREISVLSKRLR